MENRLEGNSTGSTRGLKLLSMSFNDKYKLNLISEKQEDYLFVDYKIEDDKAVIFKDGENIGKVLDVNYIKLLTSLKEDKIITEYRAGMLNIYKPYKWIELSKPLTILFNKDLEESSRIKKGLQSLPGDSRFKYLFVTTNEKEDEFYLHINESKYCDIEFQPYDNVIYIKSFNSVSRLSKKAGKLNTLVITTPIADNITFDFAEQIEFAEEAYVNASNEMYLAFIRKDKTKFLELWGEYKDIDGKLLIKLASETGVLTYSSYEKKGKVLRFYCSGLKDEEINSSWAKVKNFPIVAQFKNTTVEIGSVVTVDENYVDIELDDDKVESKLLRSNGKLMVSTLLQEIAIKRRDRAYNKLINNMCAVKDLAQIVSTKTELAPITSEYSFEGKLLNGTRKPQLNQRLAIEGAIRTPDIFLIQGPPGTGKTTVIRNIIKELKNQENCDILVSAYQNSAVDNVVEGIGDSNLLAYRYYGKFTNAKKDVGAYEFAKTIKECLTTKLEGSGEHRRKMLISSIKDKINYIITKDKILKEEAVNILKEVNSYYVELREHTDEVSHEIDLLIEELSAIREQSADGLEAELLVNFPTCFEEYEENNEVVDNFYYKLKGLEGEFNLESLKLSSKFKKQYEDMIDNVFNEGYFAKLKELAEKLVKLNPKSNAKNEAFLSEKYVNAIMSQREALLERLQANKEEKLVEIVREWQTTIESNPEILGQALQKYADIFATTCQKTGSYGFSSIKQMDVYDYIIIDEAARANPLDLFIPMTAGKRIILVGDHKQLPHIIDQAIENEILDGNVEEEEYKRYIKRSLFANLYDLLPSDRKVMLNTQYRMQQEISDVVSHLFYNDELKWVVDFKNETPLYTGKSLVSIDVKGSDLNEKNPKEAEVIIEKLKYLNDSLDAGKEKLDVGVIAFYKKQAIYISQLRSKYTFDNLEIKIDTVDAFQGIEKEVIFLSTVRSSGFGFTTDKNRLNVAMSRAKQLLVMVSNKSNFMKDADYKYIFEHSHSEV